MKTSFSAGQITAYSFVSFGAIVMLAPFYFMFVFATHDNTAIMSVPPPLWFGDELGNNLTALIDYLPYFGKLRLELLHCCYHNSLEPAVLFTCWLCICYV